MHHNICKVIFHIAFLLLHFKVVSVPSVFNQIINIDFNFYNITKQFCSYFGPPWRRLRRTTERGECTEVPNVSSPFFSPVLCSSDHLLYIWFSFTEASLQFPSISHKHIYRRKAEQLIEEGDLASAAEAYVTLQVGQFSGFSH